MITAIHAPPPHLSADKCWSNVQAGRVWVRDPVLVNLYQSSDALQQLCLIKGLRETKKYDSNLFFSATYPFISTPSFIHFIDLTGRQALLADLAMRFMLSIGLKRRSRLSSPRYAFKPSNSWRDIIITGLICKMKISKNSLYSVRNNILVEKHKVIGHWR